MNIYIHIPFCHSRCAYCAFLSHCDISKEDEYIEAVCREIIKRSSRHSTRSEESRKDERTRSFVVTQDDETINTIYFGGGTPSMMKPKNIGKIINTIKKSARVSDNIEITLESNPEDITEKNLKSWKNIGINRLSIGIQTLNKDVRKLIGRSLTPSEVIGKIKLAQRYFENIGVDIIANLPRENCKSLLNGLEALIKLDLNHISLYDLETDNNSFLAKNPEKFPLSDEEIRAENLLSAWALLAQFGYEQYEISNFAKNNKCCHHNLDFWHGKDYFGFGLGATSRINGQLIINIGGLKEYLDGNFVDITETQTDEEIEKTALACELRLNRPLESEIVPQNTLRDLQKEKLVDHERKLTPRGRLVSDSILKLLLEKND